MIFNWIQYIQDPKRQMDQRSMGPMARARPRLQTGRLQLQVFRQINHLFLSRKRREKRKMMMTRRKVLVK